MKNRFIYNIADKEYEQYNMLIETNCKCTRLIQYLVDIYGDKDFIPLDDEIELVEWKKDQTAELASTFEETELFTTEEKRIEVASRIIDELIENADTLGNTEEYVYDTLKSIDGMSVHHYTDEKNITTIYY